jgi:hypothetical protein
MATKTKAAIPQAINASTEDGPIIKSLYGGKIVVKHYNTNGRHSYFVNGKRCASVTGPIGIIDKSRQLIRWAVDSDIEFLRQYVGAKLTHDMLDSAEDYHEEKKAEAANIGTEAHNWIEAYIKGRKPDMPENPAVLQAVSSFLDWVKDQHIKFHSSEDIIYSKKHNYVGELDGRATMGGHAGLYLIDYKVSSGLYPGVAYQTAAYLKADQEESGQEYAGRWAIRLAKETESEYNLRQQKKLDKWLKKNPGKDPYEIDPYKAFEAKFMDNSTLERDFKIFLLCKDLSNLHGEVDKEFFAKK